MSTEYSLSALSGGINFAPASEAAEVLQNVRTILATRVGSVPLERALGVSWDMLDKPLPVAKALMQAAVIEAVERWEPRARVTSVSYDENTEDALQGLLHPVVGVTLADSVSTDETSSASSASSVTNSATTTDASTSAELAAAAALSYAQTAMASVNSISSRLSEIETTDYAAVYDEESDS